ncbi:hypothetical protein [Streptomyces sp. NRRL S-813]|uniref:hypothetical protein n=1 Tax=Streptomyces sp. NRRL S-813 TaxID=1463919 RepID=UPI00131C70C1|nr:hypothetical protein [Streptomyces sp. NRRL S-813]
MGERVRVSDRVAERVRRDFPDPDEAAVVIQLLEDWGNAWAADEVDRVQSAIVLSAAGDAGRVVAMLIDAHQDFRDALMDSGFADADWHERMEAAFREE